MPRDSATITNLTVSIGQYSTAGRKETNQDFSDARVPEGNALLLKGVTLAIADGISTSPVSREAAEIAVKSLLTDYYCTSDAWTVKIAASRVIAATNSWLHGLNRAARIGDIDRGHVCTLSALILKGRNAHLLHVGDSRIWRVSGGALEPLTEDHRVTLSSVETYLGRAMGVEPAVEIDYARLGLVPGDVFLLTTDGVHEHWQPRGVVAAIRSAETLDAAAETIVQEALDAGSDDNLSVQIVRVESLPNADASDILAESTALPVPPLPRIGDRIDGFRILRQIHANHRSHIFLAAAPNGRRVTLKIPATDAKEDPAWLRRFLMEEWIARRLDSPHVLKAAEAPETRSGLYVLNEFVDGQTLRQWMHDRDAPTLAESRDIIGQVIRGLRAFHRKQMLHQDLRPENVMIDNDGTVKIIDFGATRVAGVQEALRETGEEILGTLQYAAPEYFSGDPVGPRSDQFSLGVIAYEMLTGRLPYGAEVGRVRNRRDVARLKYRSACDGLNNIPVWVDDALRRATHPDPTRRFDALSELEAALRAPGGSAPRQRPLAERHPVRFWQGVSGLLAAACLALLLTR
ncbi:bifunctional protein-serine/threonine kinase/phosphatase [Tropicimonas sp. TH_r6]|uniref:bifunctional protein-serine/threonine kinase/phosphatase n=1 Tax=Tropicimonas sp. TH_r6 TaxID=3082085 RepID=UPI002955B766|nr:bifunctional protein-serine/threonine kinase/phosphatase [Tropicimonas sp. TH_r6]MDV7142127.1 bifunctional protein-serine/threonine kinase/phosphatase [Tropicimonas sp. TH_r6]